MIDDKGQV